MSKSVIPEFWNIVELSLKVYSDRLKTVEKMTDIYVTMVTIMKTVKIPPQMDE